MTYGDRQVWQGGRRLCETHYKSPGSANFYVTQLFDTAEQGYRIASQSPSGLFGVNSVTAGTAISNTALFTSGSNPTSFSYNYPSTGATNGSLALVSLTALQAGGGFFDNQIITFKSNGNQSFSFNGTLRSFTITGSAVPEPSSLALCGVAGLVGLADSGARRKSAVV